MRIIDNINKACSKPGISKHSANNGFCCFLSQNLGKFSPAAIEIAQVLALLGRWRWRTRWRGREGSQHFRSLLGHSRHATESPATLERWCLFVFCFLFI